MFRKILKPLASLKLAILLLVVIIVSAILGTYYETQFSAEMARRYVYAGLWFDATLIVLCVNLFSVAAIRYPWKPHQTGFVITHAGIIILLTGSMIDRHWGIEGFLHMHRGDPPTDVMELHDQQLVVRLQGDKEAQTAYTPLNVKVDRQFAVKSPVPDVKIDVIDNQDVHPRRYYAPSEMGDTGPAVARLQLRGSVMGVQPPQWLRLGESTDLMMASVKFVKGMPPTSLTNAANAANAANADGTAGADAQMHPRKESFYVFARQPDAMVTTLVGDPMRASAALALDATTNAPMLNLKLMGKEFSFPVKPYIGKDYALEGLDGWTVVVAGYYPNYCRINGEDATRDEKPAQPAVKFELLGPLVKGQVHKPAEGHGGHAPKGDGEAAGIVGGPERAFGISLYLGDDGKLRYVIRSPEKGESSGDVEQGKFVLLNWGKTGAEFTVDEFFPHATIKSEWQPGEIEQAGDLPPSPEERGPVPGLKFRISANGETRELWLRQRVLDGVSESPQSKTIVQLPWTPVEVGGKKIEIAFCNQFVMLPFKVGLLKFAAPLDEGSDSTTFAAFESTLSFDGHADRILLKPEAAILKLARDPNNSDIPIPFALEGGRKRDLFGMISAEDDAHLTMEFAKGPPMTVPKSDVEEWVKMTHKIYMNYPTTYPSVWYGPWLGTTYKFSQADHNPDDPNYSGVQVLRDPGWMPKWVGCLMICFGIFTMFYLKPYFHRRPEAAVAKAAVNESKGAAAEMGKDKDKKRAKMAETRSV